MNQNIEDQLFIDKKGTMLFSTVDPIRGLMNHSCNSNVHFNALQPSDFVLEQSGLMQCKAKRSIRAGEELTINYNFVSQENLSTQVEGELEVGTELTAFFYSL